jgi:hypothetical protein
MFHGAQIAEGTMMDLLSDLEIADLEQVARFMDEDPDHLNFRRFKRLHLRRTLLLQRRLVKIDEQLACHDKLDESEHVEKLLDAHAELLEKYGMVAADAHGCPS